MSRSEYTDDCDGWDLVCWRGCFGECYLACLAWVWGCVWIGHVGFFVVSRWSFVQITNNEEPTTSSRYVYIVCWVLSALEPINIM